ncbi:MAG: hypothetical protein ABH822_00095 [Patescibacteria group bacterium]
MAKEKKSEKPELNRDDFFDFLRNGRTISELIGKFSKFGLTERKIRQLLKNPPEEEKILEDNTLPGEVRYYCIPMLKANGEKRIWNYVLESGGRPAVDIIFPEDVGWKKERSIGDREDRKKEKMRLVPLSDIWFGHQLCDQSSFEERINWIAQEPHVFCFLNGDCIHPRKTTKTADKKNWDKLCQEFYGLLNPIAHKILWAQGGCFEEKMQKAYYDPIQHFCNSHNIPYFRTAMLVGVHWSGNLFTFCCIHGRGSSQKKGTKMNAAMRMLAQTEFTHFYVMSHMRDSISSKPTRVRENLFNFDLEEAVQYAFITPSFVKYDGSRDSIWGYPLPVRGQVNCVLYKNGAVFLYSSSPTTNLLPHNINDNGNGGG